jgi:hypothetical protein
MFEVPSSFGNDYHLLSLLSLISPDVEARRRCSTFSNHYVEKSMNKRGGFRKFRLDTAEDVLAGLKNSVPFHGLLCLHVPSAISRYHDSVSTVLSRGKSSSTAQGFSSDSRSASASVHAHGHNLMCSVHAYPVFAPTVVSFERDHTVRPHEDIVEKDSELQSQHQSPRRTVKETIAGERPSFLTR